MSKELLELAAKAAGKRVSWCLNGVEGDERECFVDLDTGQRWEPQDDDGDALRLAVKLQLQLRISRDGVLVSDYKKFITKFEQGENDGYEETLRTTRLAIVKVAAGIMRDKLWRDASIAAAIAAEKQQS